MTQTILNQWVTVGGIPYPEYRYEEEETEQEITIQFKAHSEYEIPTPKFTYLDQVVLNATEQITPYTIIAMRLNTINKVTGDFNDSLDWLYGILKNYEIYWFEEDELVRFNSASNYYDEI